MCYDATSQPAKGRSRRRKLLSYHCHFDLFERVDPQTAYQALPAGIAKQVPSRSGGENWEAGIHHARSGQKEEAFCCDMV